MVSPAVTTQSEGSLDDSTSSYYSSSSSSSSHDQDTTMIADPTLIDNGMTGQIDPQAIGSHDAKLSIMTSLPVGTITLTDSTLLLPDLSTVTIPATTSQLISINSSVLTPQTPSMAHMTGDFDLTSGFNPPLALFPTTSTSVLSITAPRSGLSSSNNLTIEKLSSLSSGSSLTTKVSSGSVGDLLPTGGLTIGGSLAPTSSLTIGGSLSSTLTVGGGLTSSSGLTTGGGLSSSNGLTTGGGLSSSSGLTTGGGLSSSGLITGGSLLFTSVTVGGGLLPSSGLTVGGGLSSSGNLTIGEGLTLGGLSSNGGLTAEGLLSSRSLTIGGGLLPSGGLTIGRSLSSSSDLNFEGLSTSSIAADLPSVSSVTISDLLLLNTGALLSSSGLTTGGGLSSGGLITGGGLSSSGGLTSDGVIVSNGSLTNKGGLLSNRDLVTLSSEQSSVSLTGIFTSAGGIISGGSLTSTSPVFQHLITTSSLLTSSGFTLGSGLMISSGLSPSKGSCSAGSDLMARTDLHLPPSGGLVTSSDYSPSSGLLTAGGLKLSSGLSPSITSEITPTTHYGISHNQPPTTSTSTVEWPSHVQAILDSSTFDVNQFLSSLQTNYSQLTQQVTTALPAVTVNNEVTSSVGSSVSSSTSVVTSDDEESITNDVILSSLNDIAGTLVSSIVTAAIVTSTLTTSTVTTPLISSISRTTTAPSLDHLTFTTTTTTTTTVSTQLQSTVPVTSLYTSPLTTGLYNYSYPSLSSAPYPAGQSRTTLQSSVSAVQGIPFTGGVITTLASSSSLHTLSLEDLERETSTPTLPFDLLPSSTMHNKSSSSSSSLSATSYTASSDVISSSGYLLGTSRSAPLSSKYYTPLSATARVNITPSLHVSSSSLPKTVDSSLLLSSPSNVRRQIFPPSNAPKVTSSSSSVSKQNVSLVYSSANTVSEDTGSIKQLKALHTPSSVMLSKPCCVGDSVQTHIPITNSCERWIQCKAQVIQLYRDSKQVPVRL